MTNTKINIFANLSGKVIVAAISVIFIPFYLRYLGVEVFGIIGFFASIQAFLSLLNGGISPTLNREVARLTAFIEKSQELRDVSRSLEILFWAIAVIACIIALIISPIAGKYWLNSTNIAPEDIQQSLVLMSVSLTFQWATGFYTGGLLGLQQQKLLNIIDVIIAFFRAFGAILVLAFISPTIQAFLIWQLTSAFVNCLLLVIFFWQKVPKSPQKPQFRLNLLKQSWRYAAGITGISVLVLILTQLDKIILSKMLTLEDFGYYSLANSLPGIAVGTIVGSIANVYFPQFSQLVARNKMEELREIYHRASQIVSFFLIPTISILAFFSYEILLLWTRNQQIAQKTYIMLSLIAVGVGINGLLNIPYHMQLAFGITKITFWQNVIAIILFVPFMIYSTFYYGAIGGALTIVIVNFFHTTIGLKMMHRIILKGELTRWYIVDVGFPLLATVIFLLILRSIIKTSDNSYYIFILLTLSFFSVVVVSLFALPVLRTSFLFYSKKYL